MSYRASHFLNTHKWALALFAVGAVVISLYAAVQYRSPAQVLRDCADAKNKPLCYSDRIEAMIRTQGIPAAFDALALAYDTDPEFAGTCHAVTHDLGKAAYEEFHRTGKTELTSKAFYCGYGYYHGFLDQLLIDTNDLTEARSFCTYVGKNVPHPPPPEFAEGSCYHGVGHGITDGTDPRAWGDELSIVQPGLAVCKKVSAGNNTWQSRCASGVFNALGNMYNDPKYKVTPGADPYDLCRKGKFSVIDSEACYSQMNTVASDLTGGNLPRMIAYSNTITNERYRIAALKEAVSYYVQMLKRKQQQLSATDMDHCADLAQPFQDSCVQGLVGGVYEFGSPERQVEEILAVCGAQNLNDTLRTTCYNETIEMASYYFERDVVTALCDRIPEEGRARCALRVL